jgi:flagellar hook protein FlgE
MGLFGALFAGVSGLDSQSNKIGIISNNISNVNTVGYKQGQASFDTLVVPSSTTGTFSPGGVIGQNQQLVNQQGIISATSSPTDVAISGNGFLVVNTSADGTGQPLYTRSGSFTQDANGDFVNSNGYFLQGLPILASGSAAEANSQNLKTVSINQSASGAASATSTLSISANLNSTQSVLLGPGATANMSAEDGTSAINVGATGSQIIVGNDVDNPTVTGANALVKGAKMVINNNGTGTDTFTYGGFNIGRDITQTAGTNDANTAEGILGGGGIAGGLGDGANALDISAGAAISTDGTDSTVTITPTNAADYPVGSYMSISGVAATIGGIPDTEMNGEWQVLTNVGGNITVQVGGASSSSASSTANINNRTFAFTGNILNATTATGDFMGSGATAISPSTFAPDALKFSLTVSGNSPDTFTYSSTPNPSAGTFNSLNTLAQAISDTSGLTATVANNRLYVSATDATQQVVFTNGDVAGDTTANPPLPGINWLQELDLESTATSPNGAILQTGGTTGVFNSLSGLAEEINSLGTGNLTATVNNPSGAATLSINEANPEQTIAISNGQTAALGNVLGELGFANLSTVGGDLSTGTLPVVYKPSSTTQDMSSGAVTPQFSKDITVYDSQGDSHTIALNFVKLETNTWGVEVTAVPASDVVSTNIGPGFQKGDGQLADGTLIFNGDGVLTSVTGSITNAVPINWTNGAAESFITVNLGEDSSTGLIQTAAAFNVSQATQNGSPVGELTGVSIDSNGFVTASFSNGQTQKIFQIPLASVNNPDGLESVSGNAYEQTIDSGIANLQLAGTSGVGTFSPSALEQSNVDLSTQLTDLIVAQQAYGANSKVLTVADTLLQELDQIIQ